MILKHRGSAGVPWGPSWGSLWAANCFKHQASARKKCKWDTHNSCLAPDIHPRTTLTEHAAPDLWIPGSSAVPGQNNAKGRLWITQKWVRHLEDGDTTGLIVISSFSRNMVFQEGDHWGSWETWPIPGPGVGKDQYEWARSIWSWQRSAQSLKGWAGKTWGLPLATEDIPRASKRIMMLCSVLNGILEPKTDMKWKLRKSGSSGLCLIIMHQTGSLPVTSVSTTIEWSIVRGEPRSQVSGTSVPSPRFLCKSETTLEITITKK